MRVHVLLNRSGGTLKRDPALADKVGGAFARAGVEAKVEALDPDRLEAHAEDAIEAGGIDALVIGGGDGTVGSAAARLIGTDLPLGILPFGTLNHFSRDAGIPADLDGAVAVIATGNAKPVDVAEVNGHVFVNNSSVGLYPLMVKDREMQQARFGRGKWPAMARAAVKAIWNLPSRRLTIRCAAEVANLETPILFVGNNEYETRLFALGRRASLDDGQLFLYAIKATTRFGLAKAMGRALFGRLDQARDFVVIGGVTEATIESPRPVLPVAADGEAMTLHAPLHYRLHPKALRLLVPPLASKAGAS